MLKILWKRGEIAPEEEFFLLSTIFCCLMSDFYIKTGIRFSLRDKRLFEITEVEITRVDCIFISLSVRVISERKEFAPSCKRRPHFTGLSHPEKQNRDSCKLN